MEKLRRKEKRNWGYKYNVICMKEGRRDIVGKLDRIMAQYARRHGKVFPTLTVFFLLQLFSLSCRDKKEMGNIIHRESLWMEHYWRRRQEMAWYFI